MSRSLRRALSVGAMLCLTATFASAQQPPQQQPQQTTSTENRNFEVIAVDGNDVVVKLAEGTRQLTVPEDFRFTVGGQQMSVHDLKPGMTGTATITTRTTTTPVTVTEVRNGTVAAVSGNTIIVRTAEGVVRSFSQSDVDKRDVKIMRDGQPAQLSEFRAGDRLSATIITTKEPVVVSEREVQAAITGSNAPPAPARPAPAPVATTGVAPQAPAPPPAPAPAPAAAPEHALPKTASSLPTIGLVGLMSLAIGAGLAARRRRLAR